MNINFNFETPLRLCNKYIRIYRRQYTNFGMFKRLFCGAYILRSLFLEGLIIGTNLRFKIGTKTA